MGTEAPRWWRQLLDQLQVAAAEAAAVAHDEGAANQGWQPSNLQAIVDTIGDLRALPHTLPKAVWKKLLALQVPHKLVSVCCRQPDTVQLMAQPFVLAVRCILYDGRRLCEDTSSSMSLAESFLQQLQQSDLLQHLAAAMSHTTHHIWELQSQAGSDVLAAQLADSAYDHKQSRGPSSSSLQQLHLHAGELCGCALNLERQLAALGDRSGSNRWHELLLPIAVPALELSALTIQHVSTCIELLPAWVVLSPKPLWWALWPACFTAKQYTVWCFDLCSCCAGLRQQMLHSPYYLPATCIVLLVTVYRTLIQNDVQAWWDAATSSSSSSSQQQGQQDPQLKARWAKAAWELACNRHDALPASHYLLLQLAGCSSKPLLWAATAGCYKHAEAGLTRADKVYSDDVRDNLRPGIQQDYSSPDLVPGTSVAFLRYAVLLHWVWHYLQDSRKLFLEQPRVIGRRVCVLHALSGSARTWITVVNERAVARSQRLGELHKQQLLLQQQQQQQQQEEEQQEVPQQQEPVQSLQEVLVQEPSGLFFPVPLYLQVLDDVLLLANRLLTLWLPLAAAQQQPAQAASTSTSNESACNSSRSSPSQAGSSSCPAQPGIIDKQSAAFGKTLQGCLQGLLDSCMKLSSRHMTVYAGMQPTPYQSYASLVCCPEAPVLREDASVWFQHAAQMCQVLEAYVRAVVRSQAVQSTGFTCHLLAVAGEINAAVVGLVNPTEPGLQGPLLQAAAAAGPGSEEQSQLHGLLRSALKWAGNIGPEHQVMAEQLRAAVAVAAANMLLAASREHVREEAGDGAAGETAPAAETAAEGERVSSSAAAAGSSDNQAGSNEQPAEHSAAAQAVAPQAATESVLPQLPWLGLLGCCCLQWSQQLGRLPTDNPTVTAAAAAQSQGSHHAKGVISLLPEGMCSVWGTAVQPVDEGRPIICLCTEAVNTWLTAVSDLPEPLLQPLESLDVGLVISTVRGCSREFTNVTDSMQQHPDAPVPLRGYVQELATLGEALCAVAHKQSCNNPTCSNLSGPSELQLVKVRSSTCSGCRTARYCSPECIRQHWKQHRPVCKALARTAAAAASAEAASRP